MARAVKQRQGGGRRAAWPEAPRCARHHGAAGPMVRRQPRSSVERGARAGGDHDHLIGHCEGHGSATSWEWSAPETRGERRRLDGWKEKMGTKEKGVPGVIIAKEGRECRSRAGAEPWLLPASKR